MEKILQGDKTAEAPEDRGGIERIGKKYPWVRLGRVFKGKPLLSGRKTVTADYRDYLYEISPDDFIIDENDDKEGAMDVGRIIDAFLSAGEHRIVPGDGVGEEDAAAPAAVFEAEDDLITEELAQIYLDQGLKDDAIRIYEKLSLLYPKKSVYFAEIIGNIGKRTEY